MTTSELLTQLRDVLSADATLSAWCTAQLAGLPTVWLGIDPASPPEEGDLPLVSVIGADQVRGEAKSEIEWLVHLGVGLVKEGIEKDGRKRTFTGLPLAEAFREQAENAIYRARIPGVAMATSGYSSDEWYYPLFVSYSVLTATETRSTRKGLP